MPNRLCADRHPELTADCPICRAFMPTALRGMPARLKPLPCIHFGEPTGREVECPSCGNRKVRLKTMACAVHGECLPGKQVAGVKSCIDCKDKVAIQPPRRKGIIVPQLPALDHVPTSRQAIVTIVVGEEAERCYAASGPYMRAYADMTGSDYLVLRWPGHSDWPMSAKFAIARAFDHYQRIVYVDADVLLRPGHFNLFGACAADEFGACDELAFHRAQPQHGRERAYLQFRRDMGFKDVPHLPWMLNCGVFVASRQHRELLLPPTGEIVPGHCAEQDHTNAKVLDGFIDGKVKVKLIDRRANWQNWTDHGFQSAPPDACLHWSGAIGNRIKRADDMAEWSARWPLPTFDPWQIDARHRDWIRDELMTGKYRRVLEIGCYRGYSTTAFLDAMRFGKVDEVHLCDSDMRDEVRELVGDLPGIIIHNYRSERLLDADSNFDFVFIDGNHSMQTVRNELRKLIAANVPAIFVHDTNAVNAGYKHCEGPAAAREILESAGYTCVEDSATRPGERTHRGMMLATR